MDDDEITFYIFTRRHSESSRMTHFNFYFCLLFACLLKIDESFEMKIRDLKKNETSKKIKK